MTDFRALCAELTDALDNLHALVWGECPRLLDEDRGGSGFLDLEIEETLTTARTALAEPPSLKEQALAELENILKNPQSPLRSDTETIRRAIEALPND